MTSRTTASPKSMIEWMKARSSVSMTSSAWATSAMASSSDSVTLAAARPRRRRSTDEQVGQPDQHRRDGPHQGERPPAADTMGRAEQGGPLGVVHGPVLGHRLEEDEDHHHLEDGADHHPDAPRTSAGPAPRPGWPRPAGRRAPAAGPGSRTARAARPGAPADAAPRRWSSQQRPWPSPWWCAPGWSRPGPGRPSRPAAPR